MVGGDADAATCDSDDDCDLDDSVAFVDYDVGVGEHGVVMMAVVLTLRVMMRRSHARAPFLREGGWHLYR